MRRTASPLVSAALPLVLLAAVAGPAEGQASPNDLSARVEVIRTGYGVPHVRAADLRGMGYGLAWVQLEDYGPQVAMGIQRIRGRMGRLFGRDSMESDFVTRLIHARARAMYPSVDQETRDVYEGFAAGLNRFIELHPDQFPAGLEPDFSGYDIAARDIDGPNLAAARRFIARMQGGNGRAAAGGTTGGPRARPPAEDAEAAEPNPNEGSNAWALAPSKTASRRAILLRNPHLAWDAGYYEAHVSVPGVIDYYGDFRIGGPFTVIGGFNRDLGWATTNNSAVQDAIYALDVAPGETDKVLLDGTVVPLERVPVTVDFKNGAGYSTETRESWTAPIGPVIWRGGGKVYVLRSASDGEYRSGEQFMLMMRARSLAEWKDAMRMQARATSNFTYADRAGNILYVWNVTLPEYPHPLTGDSTVVPVSRTGEVWTRYVPWDSLPQVLNPKSGYIHNENDPPHFTNLQQPLDSARLPANVPPPNLSLRSQMALKVLNGIKKRVTLEDVIRLKHTYHMLLADRVKPDLLAAVKASGDTSLTEAAALLGGWENEAAPESRGAMLFEIWWRRYAQGPRDMPRFAVPWSKDDPVGTPRGLADTARALAALRWAVPETRRRFGALDVAWGDVHRVRMGGRDFPVGGCGGDLGCFRVLQFGEEADGKLAVRGGDGWILAVEFGDQPRAYSVLGYSESQLPDSPWLGDQAELFAKGQLKKVAWLPQDVDAQAVKRYRPGAAP